MDYIRLPLIPKTDFSFQGFNPSTQEVQLIKYIPVPQIVSGFLELRLYSRTMGAGQEINRITQP